MRHLSASSPGMADVTALPLWEVCRKGNGGIRYVQEKRLRVLTQYVYRYLLFLIGLFVASLGVAFSTKAGLGTSPVLRYIDRIAGTG